MRYFDLHCDTMTECAVKDIPLRENTLHVSLEQVKDWEHYVQCYAVWLPDDLRGEAAWQRFLQVAERFAREVGDYILFMDDGQILEARTPEQGFCHPQQKRTQDFLQKVL